MWAEVSSSAPHILYSGLSDSPIRWRCPLRLLCPVRRPVTALDWVPLKDRNLALALRQGPEISSRTCFSVTIRTRQRTQCWSTNQRLILLHISCLENPRAGWVPRNPRTETPFASSLTISLPRIPACPGTQYSPTACWVETSFKVFWHCWTNGDVVLTAWRAFRTAWLSELILRYFCGWTVLLLW